MAGQVSGASSCSRLLVAAIDFGTTFSSWAFSFKHEFDSDPTKVSSKQWIGGQHVSLKAPTTVLIKPDGKTLHAFGYEAENKYAELATDNAHKKYFFFKRFKMALFDKGLSRIMTIEDDKGLSLPAKTVFSLAIKYLRDDLMKTCASRLAGNGLDDDEVHWVLTVPAIWNDAAKQFMREAAVQAGIKSTNLTIALEPEAASLFCRQIPVEKSNQCKGSLSSLKPGSKYMVLDAGGGTVDITVHEVMHGGCLKELHKANGGAWGGTRVDEAFRQMLIKIFGLPILRAFQLQCADDYLDILRDFEVKKRDITPDKDGKITFRIPSGLNNLFEEDTEEDLKQTIAQTAFANDMSLISGDKLRINVSVYKKLFKETVDSIVNHLKGLFSESCTQGIQAILMVGGFSESLMLQTAVRNNFPNMKLVIPEEAGLVVLKGAVVYGHSPSSIAERVCKHTYGVSMSIAFIEGTHLSEKKRDVKGKLYCDDIFDKHVENGQTVKFGEKQVERPYLPLKEDQSSITFDIFASSYKKPSYVTDHGCTKLGSVEIDNLDMSVPRESRNVKVAFTFSGTEIEVEAREVKTGKIVRCNVNFLG